VFNFTSFLICIFNNLFCCWKWRH